MEKKKNGKRRNNLGLQVVSAKNGTPLPYPISNIDLVLDEDLCFKCGECCREKVFVLNQNSQLFCVRFLLTKCKFASGNICAIYSQRLEREKTCASVAEALSFHAQPVSCAYVIANWDKIKDWYIPPETK